MVKAAQIMVRGPSNNDSSLNFTSDNVETKLKRT